MNAIFQPSAVAIMGASPRSAHARDTLRNLRTLGYDGPVYAVNPKYDEFEGMPCYPSLADVPETVDLATIVTAAPSAVELLDQAGRHGVRAATIYAMGFADPGPDGAPLEEALQRTARHHGMAVIGPNCMGFMAPALGVGTYSGAVPDVDRVRGGVAVITQSGSVGSALLASTDRFGIGVLLSTGNESVTTAGEYLDHLVQDDRITTVAMFLEQIRDPKRFEAAALRALESGKPVIALKVGRTDASRANVVAHSGALAGSERVNSAFLERCGVSEVRSLGEMVETIVAFGQPRRPSSSGVGFVVGSGGELSMALDLAEPIGVDFPPLEPVAKERIVDELGSWARTMANPADVWGPIPYEKCYRTVLSVLGGQDDVGALVVSSDGTRPDWQPTPTIAVDLARFAADAQEETGKPAFILCNLNAHLRAEVHEQLRPAAIPALEGTEHGLRALQHWLRWHARVGAPRPPHPSTVPSVSLPDGAGPLDERSSKAVLAAAGIATPREVFVPAAADLAAAAEQIGYPLVLKGVSPTIVHKSDLGLVRLGVTDPGRLTAAADEMRSAAPDLTGFLVVEQVHGHRELIVGVQRDPQFGPTVVLGAGGVMAEVLDDAVVGFPPLTRSDAERMIDGLRTLAVLGAWRGMPAADREAVVAALQAMGALALAAGDRLESAEINPLAVLPEGQGALALDGLVVLRRRGALEAT
ncbi:hypothetical protein PSU4_60570 [Pseudonocardia sulfidoxydans NBRC 16205]|uniref:ATP-grasp domain-containing protein n=2 Tax=Pseudonocardia sulfidoxydans TaxID=54011 RepID=A0A511DSB5_9PSEU|nr:hypothetical protein PSU4_60570 [Pseudonocardia sulfidoxydans NBRC 16205]